MNSGNLTANYYCWQPLGSLREVSRLFIEVLIETLGHRFFPLIQNQFQAKSLKTF